MVKKTLGTFDVQKVSTFFTKIHVLEWGFNWDTVKFNLDTVKLQPEKRCIVTQFHSSIQFFVEDACEACIHGSIKFVRLSFNPFAPGP